MIEDAGGDNFKECFYTRICDLILGNSNGYSAASRVVTGLPKF